MHSWMIRLLLIYFFMTLLMPVPAVGQVSQATSEPIYTALLTDTAPIVRNGRTFVPIRVISEQFEATVRWEPATRTILIQRTDAADIRLVIGSRTAQVGEGSVTLDAAPFIANGRTMVPLRFIADAYGIPVEYNVPTRSVYLSRGDRLYVLPLTSTRSGVVIADPGPGQLVRNPIRVQGQANVYEGALIVEVQDASGRVLARSFTTAGMGGFYPFSTLVYYNLPTDDAAPGRIVVYSQDGRGDEQILAQDSVTVQLASTI